MDQSLESPDQTLNLSQLRLLARRFAVDVSKLPQVRRVLLATDTGRIWTILDAPPFDLSASLPIYDVELSARDAFPSVDVDFEVLNVAEYDDVPIETVLPTRTETIWEREEAA